MILVYHALCYVPVREIRLLNLGNGDYVETLAKELKIVHDFNDFHAVDLEGLISRNGVHTEVLIMFCNIVLFTIRPFSGPHFSEQLAEKPQRLYPFFSQVE